MDYSIFMPVIDVADGMKRMMNNKKLYAKMLGKFDGHKYVDDLRAAVESGDLEAIQGAAHTLKGVTANLSMPNINQTAREIEEKAKGGEVAAELLPKLEQDLCAVSQAISDLTPGGELI